MLGYAGLNTFGSVGGGSPTFSGDVTAGSIVLTGTGAAGNGSVQITSANGYIYFNNNSATNGIITSNITAANAGATSATAMFKIYPQNALDAGDYLFSIGPQGNASSLFSVDYSGKVTGVSFASAGFSVTSGTVTCGQINAGGLIVSQSSSVLQLNGQVADGAASVPVRIGPFATYANATAHLADIVNGNGGVTRGFFDINGAYNTQMGTGTGFAASGGTANATTADVVSSGAGSTLISYTLPANALVTTNRGLRITAWGTCVNNANAKTVSLAFGSQTVISKQLAVSLANGTWKLEATVLRSGASTQDIYGEGWNENAIAVSGTDGPTILYAATRTAGTQTETATIVIKGVATTATTTDITMDALIVEYL